VTDKQRWGVIINPIAGDGFAREYVEEVKKQFDNRKLAVNFVYTEKRGHARELATKLAADGCSHIIAVGGDGTISEAANGIIGLDRIIFGVIPAGTGNKADTDHQLDLTRIRSVLGWQPQYSLANGLRHTITSFR